MYVIPEKKLVFLAQPRAASRAVRDYLEEKYHVERVLPRPMWPPGWGDHHTVCLKDIKEGKYSDYTIFTTVRNPWDWLVSVYCWDTKDLDLAPDFETYLKTRFWKYCLFVNDDPMQLGEDYGLDPNPCRLFWLMPQLSDVVIKVEELDEKLSELLRVGVKLDIVGKSDRKGYREYYTPELEEVVHNWWWRDIDDYGYSF